MSEPAGRPPTAVRIRRLPDVRKAWWHQARYEIEHVEADGQRHRTTTTTPSQELARLIGSRHPADTSAWVEAADLGWDGGLGSWRSSSGPVDGDPDEPDGPAANPSADPQVVARHARRIVDSRGAGSLAGVLPFLASILESVGEPVLASEVGGIANDLMLAKTPEDQEQVHRRLRTLLDSPAVSNLRPTGGSRTEQEVCRLLLDRAATLDR